jgi:putative tRNA adenosine deaminase-associated protein
MSQQESLTGADYAVVVHREAGRWDAGLLPARLVTDLDSLVAALGQQGGENGSIGLVNVGDDFFVVLRVQRDDVRMLLSDRTAAVAWDLARQVTEWLRLPVLDDESDVEEVWPAGDLSIFADLGMDEMELGGVLADLDANADELLARIAQRLGFAEPFERALDAAVR